MARRGFLTAILGIVVAGQAFGDDWPQYRADAARTGYTRGELPRKPALVWERDFGPPDPAWQGDDTRTPFDHAYEVVVAGKTAFLGSSADCKVYAIEADSGVERWAFCTDAPVRFAPAVWRGRVFAVSDDGHLYCLAAKTGDLLWKKRGGPRNEMLLGNDRMISRWPARGGVAVVDDTVYFGAGIWPSEGIHLYALNAETGQPVWVNDRSGGIEMDQPHGTARAKSGVSARGYLVLSEDRLFVPTGRAVPAVFSRETGDLEYFHLQANRPHGGSFTVSTGDCFINSGLLFDATDGSIVSGLRCSNAAVTPDSVLAITKDGLFAFDRDALITEKEVVDRKGKSTMKKVVTAPLWTLELPVSGVCALIVAGETAVVARSDGTITMVDLEDREVGRTLRVDGKPLGLAFADKRLFVSTDGGHVYCYGNKKGRSRKNVAAVEAAYPNVPAISAMADEIVRTAGVTEGYCADLACGNGHLAYELARRSNLHIYAIDQDASNVREARRLLSEAGLYGTRVTVHRGDPANTAYPDYFADLVVSGRSVNEAVGDALKAEASRIQRPCGGVAYMGAAGAVETWTRGPLEGAGDWTHQYVTPANPGCSTDTIVKAPLEMLWFRDSDFTMPSRHGRGPAPLFSNGRLFVEGMNGVRGINAYNGRTLWEYPIEGVLKAYDQEHLVGVAATNSNLCTDGNSVYVHTPDQCLRLDAATGKKLAAFDVPGEPGIWGYLACQDGTLFGSVADQEHITHWAYLKSDMSKLFSQSKRFFALDAETGALKWSFVPKHSIRHNAIAVAPGRVYLIDRLISEIDRFGYDAEEAKRRGETPKDTVADAELLALDSATGEVIWRTKENIFGTLLALSVEHDVLLMTEQHTRFKLPSEKGGRMTAYRASTGKPLWSGPNDPQGKGSRPILRGDILYDEPGAWGLLDGKRLDFKLERSYGCGIVAASQNLFVYRSATIGYYDLLRNEGTIDYGGARPACWINAIPAGGLVLIPDATSRCTCSYLIKTTLALKPAEDGS